MSKDKRALEDIAIKVLESFELYDAENDLATEEDHYHDIDLIVEAMVSHAEEAVREATNGNPPLPYFLDWIGARLVKVYGESPNVDFVQACHRHAEQLRLWTDGGPKQ